MTIHNDQIEEILDTFRTGESVHNVCRQYCIGKTKAYELRNRVKLESVSTIDTDESYKGHKSVVDIIGDTDSVIGTFGCTHLPFEREGYLDWLVERFRVWGVTKVVINGDLTDFHRYSRFPSHPEAMGGISEFNQTKRKIQWLRDKFKDYEVTWVLGNHDQIVARQVESLGIASHIFMKSYNDVWEVPEWNIVREAVVDGVLFVHGKGCKSNVQTLLKKRRSVVISHWHALCGIFTHASWDDRLFALNTGAGCDDNSIAMRYGLDNLDKAVLACGIIVNGRQPYVEYMELGRKVI